MVEDATTSMKNRAMSDTIDKHFVSFDYRHSNDIRL